MVGIALLVGAAGGYLLGRRGGGLGESAAPARQAAPNDVAPIEAESADRGAPRSESPPVPRSRLLGPFPLGLAAGVLVVALTGGVAVWMADLRPSGSPPSPAQTPVAPDLPEPDTAPLSPALAELDRHILANPDDLDARREMALLLLSESRFMDALGQADQILGRAPEDPTALYVQGIVRLNMGQRERGRVLLEQALTSDPDHVHSLIALGRLHLQDGRTDEALGVLQTALRAAGGTHPGIERMIAEAEGGGAR